MLMEEPQGETLSTRLIRAVQRGSKHLFVLLGPDGVIEDCSASVTPLLGWTREQLCGSPAVELLAAQEREAFTGMLAQDAVAARSGDALDVGVGGEFRVLNSDGEPVWFEFTRENFFSEPDVDGMLIVGHRVGDRRALSEAITVLTYDSDGTEAMRRLIACLDITLPATRAVLLGGRGSGSRIETVGSQPALVDGPGPWDVAVERRELIVASVEDDVLIPSELAALARQRGYRACWCLPLPVLEPIAHARFTPTLPDALPGHGDEALGCLVVWSSGMMVPPGSYLATMERIAMFIEIALRRKRDRDRIGQLLRHDHLTGALSRVGMEALLSATNNHYVHVVIDVDNFKSINDTHGHVAGDEVLRVVSRRLMGLLRAQDSVVRLGGDEFLVLCAGETLDDALPAMRRVLQSLQRPLRVGGKIIDVCVSAGAAVGHEDLDPVVVTDHADRAMYAAKQAGGNRLAVWHADPDDPSDGRIALED